jgi:hypothetical protein
VDQITVMREADQRSASRSVGTDNRYPRLLLAQSRGLHTEYDVMNFPVLFTVEPIQDLVPGSGTYGQFFFMADYQSLDNSGDVLK